ncbi:alpha-2,8-sialyltransferase 8B-like isoform X1 [Branchiostoma floridae]|uniref:Alpha-2,8-sialyltransferase 8B-like isoform X1 n=3 Tax=Branchiostoma floridae TaxID=7739 RepID=A0A9J7KU37_BRAFL|nr:alpha-2,8-sialyltransferase 8B-like isoform X1 [Branchiostoma floridae]
MQYSWYKTWTLYRNSLHNRVKTKSNFPSSMNRNPSDTVMIQRGHMKNVFFVLIVVTASYLTGLMSAAFSRDVATMHVATFDGKVSIPQQSALRSHARQSETPRDQVRKDGGSSEDIEDMNKDSSREFDTDESEEWVEPKVAIFDQREQQLKDVKLDEENDSSETGSTVEDHAMEKSNGSKPSQKNNTSDNGSGNNDKTNTQDISEGPDESESVLNHSKQKEKKKKKESKEKTDGISTWKMKKLTDATKIKKKISAMFNVSQDIVYFSDYDKHISRCYKNGTFQLGCKGKTPIRRYSTCAAVGGSGILIGSGCGAEIDAHDFVIRYNMPQLEKYRDDVGVKVNLSAMDNYALRFINQSLIYNPTYITSRYKQYNNSIFFYPKTIYEPKKGIKGLGSYARLKMFRKNIRAYGHVNITMAYSLRNFKNISEQFMRRIIPDFDSPTVGLMTYLLALTFCDHLDLYGFYPFMTDPQGKPIHFHYHMDQQPDKFSEGQSPHAFVNEYNFMSLLHKRGVVKATVGKCQVGTQGGATK